MQKGQLFEFTVSDLPERLKEKFGNKADPKFSEERMPEGIAFDEVFCGGCGHKTGYLYAVAPDEDHALQEINGNHAGLCGNCIANLIADKEWEIYGSHLFCKKDSTSLFKAANIVELLYSALREFKSAWIQDVTIECKNDEPQIILTVDEGGENILFSITEEGIQRLTEKGEFIH